MKYERERLIELLNKKQDFGGILIKSQMDDRYTTIREKNNEDIADYLLENGVIVPPCKVGDTIYMIVEKRTKITRDYFRFIKTTKLTFSNMERVINEIGKTVFLNKEEAEQALKERF